MVGEFVVEHQSFIRELINGALMITCGWCAAICGLYVFDAWRESTGDGEWRKHLGTKVACALAWVFAFESYRTGSIWSVYYTTDIVAPTTGSFIQTVGFMVGGVGLIVAILWCTYLFSPPRYVNRLWQLSFINTVLFLVAAVAVKQLGNLDGF